MKNNTYVIAEVGINHNGSLSLAKSMIKALCLAGVDAVKFQLCNPEELYSRDSFKPTYQVKNVRSVSPIEMSRKYQLPYDNHLELYKVCQNNNIDYLCSAFDIKSLEFLDQSLDLKFFKIASGEIFSLDMIDYISQIDRKILLSTGMASFTEIEHALLLLNRNFKKDITLLHCVSNYPTPADDVNLNVMLELKRRFNYPVGFSDHTIGNLCALAAVAMGAVVIEKHVTSDKSMPGPDHKMSSTIEEFSELVKDIRVAEKVLGHNKKVFSDAEIEIKKSVRKSIVSKTYLTAGTIISLDDICVKRPGTGFTPLEKDAVVGRKVKRDIDIDRVIKKEDLY